MAEYMLFIHVCVLPADEMQRNLVKKFIFIIIITGYIQLVTRLNRYEMYDMLNPYIMSGVLQNI